MNIVKKLTTKHIFGGPKNVLAKFPEGAKNGDHIDLFHVAGIASKVREGESTMGTFEELQGDFVAVLPNGERYQSGKCFIPDGAAHDTVVNAARNSEGDVEFALHIGATRDDSSASGYTYTAKTLTVPQQSDRMAALLSTTGVAQIGSDSGESKGSGKK